MIVHFLTKLFWLRILIYICPRNIKIIGHKFAFHYLALYLIYSKWPPKRKSLILNHLQKCSKSTYLYTFFGFSYVFGCQEFIFGVCLKIEGDLIGQILKKRQKWRKRQVSFYGFFVGGESTVNMVTKLV